MDRQEDENVEDEEGENNHEKTQASDHENEETRTREENSTKRKLASELSHDMKKVIPPKFEGTTSSDAVEA